MSQPREPQPGRLVTGLAAGWAQGRERAWVLHFRRLSLHPSAVTENPQNFEAGFHRGRAPGGAAAAASGGGTPSSDPAHPVCCQRRQEAGVAPRETLP